MTGGDEVRRLTREALAHLRSYKADHMRGDHEHALADLMNAWRSLAAAFAVRLAEYPGYAEKVVAAVKDGGLKGLLLGGLDPSRLPARLGEAAEKLVDAWMHMEPSSEERAAEDMAEALEALLDSDPATLCRHRR